MYKRLYPSRYKSRLYLSWYKRDEGGNNKVLVTVWLEAKVTQYWNHVTINIESGLRD